MKKIILLAVIAIGAWQFYQNEMGGLSSRNLVQAAQGTGAKRSTAQPAQQFRCDGRQHCSQMTSRAEAEFFTRNCPNTKMDGDRDGIPCENDS